MHLLCIMPTFLINLGFLTMNPTYAYFNYLKQEHESILFTTNPEVEFYLLYDENQPHQQRTYPFIVSPQRVEQISEDPLTRVKQYFLLTPPQVKDNIALLFPHEEHIMLSEQPITARLKRTAPLTAEEVITAFGFDPRNSQVSAFPTREALFFKTHIQQITAHEVSTEQKHLLLTELLNLTNEHGAQLICHIDDVIPLIALLNQDAEVTIIELAVSILLNLSQNPANQETIREAQGITPLINLLNISQDLSTIQSTTATLSYLAQNPTNHDAIREAQGIAPLINRLNISQELTVIQYITATLANLAQNPINQNAIREAQGIAPLINLLNISQDPTTIHNITTAFMYLTQNPINHDAIREAQGIAPLINLLNISQDLTVIQYITATLANLAKEPTNQDAIREGGGIIALIALLTDKDPLTLQLATKALENLTENTANRHAIYHHHGLTALLSLCINHPGMIRLSAIKTAFKIIFCENARECIFELTRWQVVILMLTHTPALDYLPSISMSAINGARMAICCRLITVMAQDNWNRTYPSSSESVYSLFGLFRSPAVPSSEQATLSLVEEPGSTNAHAITPIETENSSEFHLN